MAGDLTGVTLELLEEFTVSWSRGDNPDPRSVLARAPEQDRDDLRDLIDRFLRSQPAVGLTEDSLGLIRQIGLAAEGGSQPRDAAAPGEADMIGSAQTLVDSGFDLQAASSSRLWRASSYSTGVSLPRARWRRRRL